MTRSVGITVHGEVQGVSFRAYAAHEAVRLEVTGWVRNADDGTVEAHVEGDDDAVGSFVAWCRSGSPAARVASVDVRDEEPTGASSFEVEY